jgi:hypothetical protein
MEWILCGTVFAGATTAFGGAAIATPGKDVSPPTRRKTARATQKRWDRDARTYLTRGSLSPRARARRDVSVDVGRDGDRTYV